ncbi:hypothetical protein [Actinoallomurus acanthiterrae]
MAVVGFFEHPVRVFDVFPDKPAQLGELGIAARMTDDRKFERPPKLGELPLVLAGHN